MAQPITLHSESGFQPMETLGLHVTRQPAKNVCLHEDEKMNTIT